MQISYAEYNNSYRRYLSPIQIKTVACVVEDFLRNETKEGADFKPNQTQESMGKLITGARPGIYENKQFQVVHITFSTITSQHEPIAVMVADRNSTFTEDGQKTRKLLKAINDALLALRHFSVLLQREQLKYAQPAQCQAMPKGTRPDLPSLIFNPSNLRFSASTSEENFFIEGLNLTQTQRRKLSKYLGIVVSVQRFIHNGITLEVITCEDELYMITINQSEVVFKLSKQQLAWIDG